MNDVYTLLSRCEQLGAEFIPLPDGKLKVKAPVPLPATLRDELKQRKTEVLAVLTRPHLNARGELIIPFNSDPKYHWWKPGGQSIAQTLTELNAPAEVWRSYIGSYTETRQ